MVDLDHNPPSLVITAEDIARTSIPFVVAYGGQVHRLRNPNSLSVDDTMKVDKTSESSMLDALILVALDEDEVAWLRGIPFRHLKAVFDAWSGAFEAVEAGESDGSEASSEPDPAV